MKMAKKYQVLFFNAIVATDWVKIEPVSEEISANGEHEVKISVEQGYTIQKVEKDPYFYIQKAFKWLQEKNFFSVSYPYEAVSKELQEEYKKDFDEYLCNTDQVTDLIPYEEENN